MSTASDFAQWYLSINGLVQGPYPEIQLRAAVESGQLNPQTQACPAGQQAWQELRNWPAFASSAPLTFQPKLVSCQTSLHRRPRLGGDFIKYGVVCLSGVLLTAVGFIIYNMNKSVKVPNIVTQGAGTAQPLKTETVAEPASKSKSNTVSNKSNPAPQNKNNKSVVAETKPQNIPKPVLRERIELGDLYMTRRIELAPGLFITFSATLVDKKHKQEYSESGGVVANVLVDMYPKTKKYSYSEQSLIILSYKTAIWKDSLLFPKLSFTDNRVSLNYIALKAGTMFSHMYAASIPGDHLIVTIGGDQYEIKDGPEHEEISRFVVELGRAMTARP